MHLSPTSKLGYLSFKERRRIREVEKNYLYSKQRSISLIVSNYAVELLLKSHLTRIPVYRSQNNIYLRTNVSIRIPPLLKS